MSATVYCLLLFIGPFFNMFSLKNKARKAWIFVARKQKECRKTIALLSFSWRRKLSWLYANALWKCRKGKCSSCSFWLLFFVLPSVLLLNFCLLNGAWPRWPDLSWKAVNFSDDWTNFVVRDGLHFALPLFGVDMRLLLPHQLCLMCTVPCEKLKIPDCQLPFKLRVTNPALFGVGG